MFYRSLLKRVAWASLAGFSVLVMGSAAHAQGALFSPVSSAGDSGAQTDLVARIAAKPTTKSLDLVRIDLSALQSDAVSMSLRNGDAVANKQRTLTRSADNYTWVGTFPGGGDAVLVVMNGEITGQIQKGLDGYKVQPVGNGVHAIVGIDPSKFPADHPTLQAPLKLNKDDSGAKGDSPVVTTADGVQVDVLVAWTVTARNAYGSSMPALAQLSVDVSNTAYTNSNANVSMRLVGTQEITYSETGKTFDTVLSDLVAGTDSQMAIVHTKRDAVGADLTGLLINLTDYCGLAADISASAANAYMTAYYGCAVDNNSFSHEMGHLFGARHDTYVDPTNTPYPYGHGYIEPGNTWRTIMAYVNGCGNCPRLRFFSNPSLTYNGIATGTVATNDNARVHRERVSTVAGFRSPVTTSTIKAPHDFNGDLKSDILWRNTGGSNAIWLMNGATPTVSVIGGVDTSWTPVGQRDFDGDGKSDILWRNNSGNNAIWFMNGASVTSVALIGGVATNWYVAGTGDFNGDGKGDILWRNTDGTVAVWLMNGSTVSSVALLGGVATNWTVYSTGDFDGDGKTDVLWRNTGGSNAIWLMNGVSAPAVSVIGGVAANWTPVGTGDFNGDGKTDILWRNSDGVNAVWLMNGTSVASVASISGVATNWSVASNGDYNGDGKADILWREQGGSNFIWFMNGATVTSVTSIGGVATNWSIFNGGAN